MREDYLLGKRRKKNGYIMLFAPHHPFCQKNGWILEHRVVLEVHLGRFLHREEVVHHINEIKDDNRVQNLMAIDRQSHGRLHNKHRFKTKAVKELYINGLSVRQVGERLGIGKSTVHTYCSELGISRKKTMN